MVLRHNNHLVADCNRPFGYHNHCTTGRMIDHNMSHCRIGRKNHCTVDRTNHILFPGRWISLSSHFYFLKTMTWIGGSHHSRGGCRSKTGHHISPTAFHYYPGHNNDRHTDHHSIRSRPYYRSHFHGCRSPDHFDCSHCVLLCYNHCRPICYLFFRNRHMISHHSRRGLPCYSPVHSHHSPFRLCHNTRRRTPLPLCRSRNRNHRSRRSLHHCDEKNREKKIFDDRIHQHIHRHCLVLGCVNRVPFLFPSFSPSRVGVFFVSVHSMLLSHRGCMRSSPYRPAHPRNRHTWLARRPPR
mmetsp:Transcript_6533/g.14476  ORF Transcript_6533/g.14476 Transcript_6533/m.14476 type:complete len:297 (-) Transcript_6533:1243-2133(-)